jgi:hypothetical protein
VDYTNARIITAQCAYGFGCIVRGIVVDKDRLPPDAREAGVQAPRQFRDISAFVERWNYD